jgi:hypothetical protein
MKPKRMSNTPLTFFLLSSLILLNSCAALLQKQVNKRFPPTTAEARKVQNLVASSFALAQIDTASVGVHLPSATLEQVLTKELKKNNHYAINDADSIVLDTSSVKVSFENQDIRLDCDATVYISPNSTLKALKKFNFHIQGFVSPFFVDDDKSLLTTLHLNPNMEDLKISRIKFRNFFLQAVSPLAQYIVDDFSKRFINNINGLLPDVKSELDMSFISQKKYSELIVSPEIEVVHDDNIVINKKLGNKAILINPAGLSMAADIKEIPTVEFVQQTAFNISTSKATINRIVSKYLASDSKWRINKTEQEIKKKSFNEMFDKYTEDFSRVWNTSLDSFINVVPSQINTQLSQKFIVAFVNELLNKPSFAFNLKPQILPAMHIDKTRIELLEKPKWDCNEIQFHCDLANCNNVFHDCGSCKWYDVPCHARWTGCQIANGIAYAGCQAANVVRLGACTVSYVGQKAFCFAKYAVLYAAHDLTSVGDIEGDVNISVAGNGSLGRFSMSNDLTAFSLNTSQLKGSGTFDGNIHYSKDWEVTLTSILQCNCLGVYVPIPIGCDFPIPQMKGQFDFPELVSGKLNKINDPGKYARLLINTDEVPILVQFKDQTPFQAIFENAKFHLKCQVLFFGTVLWGIAGNFFKFNDKLQEKYDAIFKGTYTYKFSSKQFQLSLPAISLNLPDVSTPITLYSSWTDKSITYKQ